MRQEIENTWGFKAMDIYGLSEIIGPGVAIECCGQDGLHFAADHFYPEIIDPATEKKFPQARWRACYYHPYKKRCPFYDTEPAILCLLITSLAPIVVELYPELAK